MKIETSHGKEEFCTGPASTGPGASYTFFIYIVSFHLFNNTVSGIIPPRLQNPEPLGCNTTETMLANRQKRLQWKEWDVCRTEGRAGGPGFPEDEEQ